jgi:hypothetical protein
MYNPFGKEFEDIDIKSLDLLIEKEVREGWFFEFKISPPKNEKICKAVTAFSNSKGGWLLIGIRTEKNVAVGIEGFEVMGEDPVETFRRIILSGISPIPDFKIRSVALENGKIVLILKISETLAGPFIAADGQIYVRYDAESKPETDRHMLQRLFDRGIRNEEWISHISDKGLLKDYKNPYIEIMFFKKPINKDFIKQFFDSNFKNEIILYLNTPTKIFDEENPLLTANLPVTQITSSYISHIFRLGSDLSENPSTFLEIRADGIIRLAFPISWFDPNVTPNPIVSLDVERLTKFKNSGLIRNFKHLHGFEIFMVMQNMIHKISWIYREKLGCQSLGYRIKIDNVKNNIMYFDSDFFENYTNKFGVPMCLRSSVEVPDFFRSDHFNLDLNESLDFIILSDIFSGLGFSMESLTDFLINGFHPYLQRLQLGNKIEPKKG